MADTKAEKADKAAKAANASPVAGIQGTVTGIVSAIPIGFLKDWVLGYFQPEKIPDMQKGRGLVDAAIYLAIVGFLAWIVFVPSTLLTTILSSDRNLVAAAISIAIMFVAYPIMFVIGSFIGSAVYFVLAKILGGKGSFTAQTYALALITGGMMLLSLPFNILGLIPCLGIVFSLVALVISLYGIYSEYRMMKVVHQLSSLKAAAVIIIPLLVVIAIIAVLVVIGAVVGLAGLAAAGNGY